MKINPENIRIATSILISWIRTMILVNFMHPRRYLEKILEKTEYSDDQPEINWVLIKKVVKGTRRLSPLFQKSRRCLVESMIVKSVLHRHDIVSTLNIGAKRDEKKITTHAWIEIDGKTVIGGSVTNYKSFIRTH